MNTALQMKRPAFIIFTDKDGTLNLEDKKLNQVFTLISTMNGIVIPITGRTVGDIYKSLQENNLRIPEILIGDNGANIYSTKQKQFLMRKSLDPQKVSQVITNFVEAGGNPQMVRLTDGEFIYAVNHPDVQDYYRKNSTVKYGEDVSNLLKMMPEITKITLAGSKAQMEDMSNYVEDLNFWSDMGSTKFPNASYEHYRLDVADKNINKGNAVKLMVSILQPTFGYMCIGNGENDIPMFKQAIDDNMMIGIMEDSPQAVKDEMKAYVASKKKRQNYHYS